MLSLQLGNVLMDATLATDLGGLLTNIGSVFTQFIAWIGSVTSAIIANPLAVFMIGAALVGVVIAYVKRLIHTN